MADLGKVAIRPRGEWVIGLVYERLDVVVHNLNTYLALKDNAAEPSDDGENWMLLLEGVPVATTETAGKAKPDGDTITVDEDGTLHGASQVPEGVTFVDLEAEDEALPERIPVNADQLGGQKPEYYAAAESVNKLISGETTAGNADTLGGYHAEDFCKTDEYELKTFIFLESLGLASADMNAEDFQSNIIAIKDAMPNNSMLRCSLGVGDNFVMSIANKINSDLSKAFTAESLAATFEYKKTTENSPTLFKVILEGGGASIYNEYSCVIDTTSAGVVRVGSFAETMNPYGYLPLAGGTLTSQTGNVALNLRRAETNSQSWVARVATGMQLSARNVYADGSNERLLYIHDSNGQPSLTKALQLVDVVESKQNIYTVLHTGNAVRMLIGGAAPTDTTTAWIDTGNKVIKIYIDGAWTAVS